MIFTPGNVQSCENSWELLKQIWCFYSYGGNYTPHISNISYREIISEQPSRGDRNIGGNSNIFEKCSPRKLGKINPIWRTDFSDGLKTTNYPWTPKPRKMKENPQYMGYNPETWRLWFPMVVMMLPIFPVHICHGTDKSVERLVLVAHGYKLGIAVRVPNNLLFRFNHFQWGVSYQPILFIYCLLVQYRMAQVIELVVSMLVMKPIRYICSKQWVHSYP